MRILYVAIDQSVPGTKGGSIHVEAVARGLAALGHDVEVLAATGDVPFPVGSVRWRDESPPFGSSRLRWMRSGRILAIAKRLQPDVIIERYHNFGGEGVRAARAIGALAVLEVNAPVVDYEGSPKRMLDRALLFEPMRRWREWQCSAADLLITPSAAILPVSVPRSRVLEIEWGADTDRFNPGARGEVPYRRTPGETTAVFAGAFRPWHGAINLVHAVRQLRERGRRDVKAAFIGSGPELDRVRRAAGDLTGVVFAGTIPNAAMPAYLAAADVGVAPFDRSAHPPLTLGFYWSPLKIFEYMSAGLPVVAPAIERLKRLVEHGREGLLYDEANPEGLSKALEELADPARRAPMGASARARAVAEFSWTTHCRRLEAAISSALDNRMASAKGARHER